MARGTSALGPPITTMSTRSLSSIKEFTFRIQPTLGAQSLTGDNGPEMPSSITISLAKEDSGFPLPWDAAPDMEIRNGKKGISLNGAAGPGGDGIAEVWLPLEQWVAHPPVTMEFTGTWDMFTELVGMGWEVQS